MADTLALRDKCVVEGENKNEFSNKEHHTSVMESHKEWEVLEQFYRTNSTALENLATKEDFLLRFCRKQLLSCRAKKNGKRQKTD